jgi:hypothetical protein
MYESEDLTLSQCFALKFLPDDLAHGPSNAQTVSAKGRFELREIALETEFQRQLRNACTHRCATDDAEGRGREVAIGICKLRMVERVES